MAELDAIDKKLQGLTPVPTLNADGSAVIRLTGNAHYNPVLDLTRGDVATVLKGLSAPIVAPPPAKPPVTPPATPPVTPPVIASRRIIIGTCDFSGWQEAPAKTMIAAGIKCGRHEGTSEVARALGYGHDPKDTLVIIGNTSDGQRLSAINQSALVGQCVKECEELVKLGVEKAELLNEWYLKGVAHNKECGVYEKLYLAVLAAIRAKGLAIRLYAGLDCELSQVEGMSAEFWAKVQGFTIHPYGTPSWSYGLAGYLQCLAYASQKGANVGYIVSEYGVELNGQEQGSTKFPGFSALNETLRGAQVETMYNLLTADRTAGGCEGIYYFQSHDDDGTTFGFMDNTNKPRELMNVISKYALANA